MNNSNTALSRSELHELDAFLDSDDVPEAAMDLSTLEGFFTAIVIGPATVMPSQWMPWVWDMDEGRAEVTYASMEQAQRIMGLLMRMMNEIARTFMRDPASFEPIYRREAQWGAAEWCEGFFIGTQFAKQQWAMLWVAKPKLVTPFARLGTEEGIKITSKAGDGRDWMDPVAPALVEIHAFWKEQRGNQPLPVQGNFLSAVPRQPIKRAEPKLGRNDLCPCGSGEKFKKCCGADKSTLH
jgi:uncharacterized protein